MKTTHILLWVLLSACIALPVHALDLQQAKQEGMVGEMANGYLGTPNAKPAEEVILLIQDINRKRKAKYQQLATKQGLSLDAVEKLAGEKSFEKTAAGHFIKVPGAGWQKK